MNVRSSFCSTARAFAAKSLNGAALARAGGALALFLAMAGTAAHAERLLIAISGPDYPQSFFINTSDALASSDGGFLVFEALGKAPVTGGGGKGKQAPGLPPRIPPQKAPLYGIEFGDKADGGGVNFGFLDLVSGSSNDPAYSIDPILVSLDGRGFYRAPGLALNILPGETFTFSDSLLRRPRPGSPPVETITVTAVPEISTWAMMLSGFAGMGLWRRGRNRLRSAA